MNASSSSDDDDAPGASTWEREDETSEASGDSNAAGERALRVEAAATKRHYVLAGLGVALLYAFLKR